MQLRQISLAVMTTGCLVIQANAIPLGPLSPDTSNSQIDIDNFEFATSAFPDVLVSHTLEHNDLQGRSVLRALNDDKLTSYIDPDFFDDYVILRFTDNAIRNEAGYDLAIFELWAPEAIRISLSSDKPGITVTPIYTGFKTTFNNGGTGRVNIAWVDLTDLGIADGGLVHELLIGATGSVATEENNAVSSPEIAGVAAIHNVPEPGTVALFGLGLGSLLLGRRHWH